MSIKSWSSPLKIPMEMHSWAHGGCVATLNNMLVFIGGRDLSNEVDGDAREAIKHVGNEVKCYNAITNAWTTLASLNEERCYMAVGVHVDGRIIVAGGTYKESCEIY